MSVLYDFVIIYATQTGNAKAISDRINQFSPEHSLRSCVYSVDTLDSLVSSKDCCCNLDRYMSSAHGLVHVNCPVVFVCSTTGDGDPPDTAVKLFRALNRFGNDVLLANVNYALLGLGDTNYNTYE